MVGRATARGGTESVISVGMDLRLPRRSARAVLALFACCLHAAAGTPDARAAAGDPDGSWIAVVECDRSVVSTGGSYSFSVPIEARSGKITGKLVRRNAQGLEDSSEWQGSMEGGNVTLSAVAWRAGTQALWSYNLTGKLVAGGPSKLDGGEFSAGGGNHRKTRDCRATLVAITTSAPATVPAAARAAPTPARGSDPGPTGRESSKGATGITPPGGVVVPFPDTRRATPPSAAPQTVQRPAPIPAARRETELDRAGADLDRALAARRGTGANAPQPAP